MTKQVYKKIKYSGASESYSVEDTPSQFVLNFRVVRFDVEKMFGCSYQRDFPSRENDIVQDGAYLRPHTSACSQHFFYLKK